MAFQVDAGNLFRTKGSPAERHLANARAAAILDTIGLDFLNASSADRAELDSIPSPGFLVAGGAPGWVALDRNGVKLAILALGSLTPGGLESLGKEAREVAAAAPPGAVLRLAVACLETREGKVEPEEILARLSPPPDPPPVDVLILSSGDTRRRDAEIIDSTFVAYAPAEGQHLGRLSIDTDGHIAEEWLSLFAPGLTDRAIGREVAALNDSLQSIRRGVARSTVSRREEVDPRWAGSAACGACHTSEAAIWDASAHARAMATLVEARRDYDPDCLPCHVTGWGEGYVNPDLTPNLGAVQCEACHGPGSAHAADPDLRPSATPERLCVRCHTEENSPKFDAAAYLSQIRHW